MRASVRERGAVGEDFLPQSLPHIALHHGEALRVLSHVGFQGAASRDTFHEYVKSLRKLGTPFEHGKIGLGRRGLANSRMVI